MEGPRSRLLPEASYEYSLTLFSRSGRDSEKYLTYEWFGCHLYNEFAYTHARQSMN